jgi:Protein of unknown function (DUF3995)
MAALLLIVGLAAPAGEHLYWLLGGSWGLHPSDGEPTTSTRVVSAVVIALLVAAAFVVLARAGLWRQGVVSDRVIRLLTWALAGVFLLETLASFTYSREHEWWLYGPVALVIALLALVVAGTGGARPRFHRPHRALPSH